MKTLVLTGSRGLIGDAVLRHFLAGGWRVIAASSGNVRANAANVIALPFDLDHVADNRALDEAMATADAVVHCAAMLPSSGLLATAAGSRRVYAANVLGTYDLMDMAARHGVPRMVFLSSANLFRQPPDEITEDIPASPGDAYMLSKLAGEAVASCFAQNSATIFTCLRVSAPFGARFTANAVIPNFVTRALAGQPLTLMGTGARQQVFTYVADIARAGMAAVDGAAPGIFNIAGGAPTSMLDLAAAVLRAVGDTAAEIVLSGQPDPAEGVRRRISIERARQQLGWEPEYDIDRGLQAMVAELRNPPRPLLVSCQA